MPIPQFIQYYQHVPEHVHKQPVDDLMASHLLHQEEQQRQEDARRKRARRTPEDDDYFTAEMVGASYDAGTRGAWTAAEDDALCSAVLRYEGKDWEKIAQHVEGRDQMECLERWTKHLKPSYTKRSWSKEEDEALRQLINKYGPKRWSVIALHLPGRVGKQCRER